MRRAFIPPTRHEFDGIFLEGHVRGGGLEDIRIFLPPPIQRGRRGAGIFTALSGLAKRAIPFLMRNVAPEAVRMGKGVIGDVLEGRRLRDSLKARGLTILKGVGERLARGGKIRKKHKKVITKKRKKRQLKSKAARVCYKNDIFNSAALL